MTASLLAWLLIHVLLLAALVMLLKGGVGDTAAALLAVLLVLAFPEQYIPERWSMGLIIYALAYATNGLPRLWQSLTPYVLGASLAMLFCAKAGATIPAGIVGVITLWWVGRWRHLAAASLSGILTLLGIWLITGNDLGAVAPYLAGSMDLANGFAQAMGTGSLVRFPQDLVIDYVILAALTATIFGVFWYNRRSYPMWRLMMVVALIGVWHWFRYSYIRPDGRRAIVFWFLAVVATWFIASRRELLKTGVVLAITCLVFSSGLTGQSLLSAFDLAQGASNLKHHVLLAVSPPARQVHLDDARRASKDAFAIPDGLVQILRASPGVHVDSYQLTTVWTYDLPWTPAPVFQSYSAYTQGLDARNAAALAAFPQGHAILRRDEPAIDGRFRRFESPAYMAEMVCSYRHEAARADWQVLLKVDNRCDEPRLIGMATVHNGDIVPIPGVSGPSAMMTARVRLGNSLTYEVERLAFKPREAEMLLDGGAYRFLRGTAAGPLILIFPQNSSFALGHLGTDGPPSFETIGLTGLYSAATIEFWEVPVEFD